MSEAGVTLAKGVKGVDELHTSLQQSAVNRKAMTERFGFIPLSVLKISRGELSRHMFVYQREVPERSTVNYEKTREKLERLHEAGYTNRITASQRGMRKNGLAATIMPAELVEFFVKYYAKPGDLYIDPFFGQGIQMQVAVRMGLSYIGYDISHEFFAYVDAVRQKIDVVGADGTAAEKPTIQLYLADSRNPDKIADRSADFCFTSPPYWDTEYYGSEPEQLGETDTYEEFLAGMSEIALAWHKKFKPGAWVVINVNDFRRDAKLYPYHADTIGLFMRAGYSLHDVWVIDGLVGGLPKAFAVDFNLKRIAPKVHEYALVFRA